MPKSMLRRLLPWIGGCLLLVLCLQATPISISRGQTDRADKEGKHTYLQPGQLYVVHTAEPMRLPQGMWLEACATYGASFLHRGKAENSDKPCCGGIKTLLRDDGSMEYKCVACGKSWIKNADVKPIADPNKK
jgi:hypothetical protein